jgi:hypothetical protein
MQTLGHASTVRARPGQHPSFTGSRDCFESTARKLLGWYPEARESGNSVSRPYTCRPRARTGRRQHLEREVQIVVWPGLLAEHGVHAPPAIEPPPHPDRREQVEHVQDLGARHHPPHHRARGATGLPTTPSLPRPHHPCCITPPQEPVRRCGLAWCRCLVSMVSMVRGGIDTGFRAFLNSQVSMVSMVSIISPSVLVGSPALQVVDALRFGSGRPCALGARCRAARGG